eukprot:gene7470-biopygen151
MSHPPTPGDKKVVVTYVTPCHTLSHPVTPCHAPCHTLSRPVSHPVTPCHAPCHTLSVTPCHTLSRPMSHPVCHTRGESEAFRRLQAALNT